MRYQSSALVVLIVVLAGVSSAIDGNDAYKRVSDQVVCQCGCNYPLDSCPHTDCPWAPKIRAAIREHVAAGESEQVILAGLVAQYGQVILAAPPAEGFNIVGWVMPFLAFIAGLWLVRRIVLTWRARKPEPPADAALLARYQGQIEKELRNREES